VESAPNAMILTNKNGDITLINNQTEKLFGYDRKELIGNKLEIFIPERFRTAHPRLRGNFFNEPSVRAMGGGRELFARRKDGTEFPVEIGLNPIETDEGMLVLASVIDITERKRQKQLMELEARNKELEQFNYIASHDLQEPLRTVSNYIQILEEDYFGQMDESAKKYIDTIHRATKRMSALVHSLLEFSRVGHNKELASINCQQLVSSVIADLDAIIKNTDAKINLHELPTINGLETEMRQLFQNLINNAIKFRREDSSPQIDLRCKEHSTHYEFSISDNGIGIDEKNFDKVFYIFNRLNQDDRFSGYGIGLANCKKIVELHSGRIWIESSLGKGSTFRFTIAKL
jgi:PAS domain S-box-containing protein